MNAYTYIRVSSKGQIEGDGPERQRLACAAFAKIHNISLEAEFFDAFTGAEEHRPEFDALLSRIDKRNAEAPGEPIGAVIVERMDRLARDLMASECLLRELRNRGVKLFVTDQGTLDDQASNDVDPTRILIRQLMAALAQWEKSTLVRKLRVARERAAAEGRVGGAKPYGLVEGENEGLRQLVEWSHQGYSSGEVADMMNARDYPTRTGVRWTRHTVQGILTRAGQNLSKVKAAQSARLEIANLLAPK